MSCWGALASFGPCVFAQDGDSSSPARHTSPPDAALERAKACFEAAQSAYAHEQLAQARDGFRCAYELAPSPELAWNLARVLERMGEVQESIGLYRVYLESGPHEARERKQVEQRVHALQALLQRQTAQASRVMPTAKELSAEARVFFERGVKLFRRGRYEAALAAFSAAMRLSGAAELRYNLALTSERLGLLADAIDHYHAYLAARPDADDNAAITAHVAALRAKLP